MRGRHTHNTHRHVYNFKAGRACLWLRIGRQISCSLGVAHMVNNWQKVLGVLLALFAVNLFPAKATRWRERERDPRSSGSSLPLFPWGPHIRYQLANQAVPGAVCSQICWGSEMDVEARDHYNSISTTGRQQFKSVPAHYKWKFQHIVTTFFHSEMLLECSLKD